MGTPHRCVSEIVLEDMIANLVSQAGLGIHFWQAADNIKRLTKAIMDTNGCFDITNLASLTEIISIVSNADQDTSVRLDPGSTVH